MNRDPRTLRCRYCGAEYTIQWNERRPSKLCDIHDYQLKQALHEMERKDRCVANFERRLAKYHKYALNAYRNLVKRADGMPNLWLFIRNSPCGTDDYTGLYGTADFSAIDYNSWIDHMHDSAVCIEDWHKASIRHEKTIKELRK